MKSAKHGTFEPQLMIPAITLYSYTAGPEGWFILVVYIIKISFVRTKS